MAVLVNGLAFYTLQRTLPEYVASMQRGGAPYIFRSSIHSTDGKLNSVNFAC